MCIPQGLDPGETKPYWHTVFHRGQNKQREHTHRVQNRAYIMFFFHKHSNRTVTFPEVSFAQLGAADMRKDYRDAKTSLKTPSMF